MAHTQMAALLQKAPSTMRTWFKDDCKNDRLLWIGAYGSDPNTPSCGPAGQPHDVFQTGKRHKNRYAVTYHCGVCNTKLLHIPVKESGAKREYAVEGRGMRFWGTARDLVLLQDEEAVADWPWSGPGPIATQLLADLGQGPKAGPSEPPCANTTARASAVSSHPKAWILAGDDVDVDGKDTAKIVVEAICALKDVDKGLEEIERQLISLPAPTPLPEIEAMIRKQRALVWAKIAEIRKL